MEYPDDVIRAVAEGALPEWGLAGAKVVVAGDEKKLNILIRPTPLVDQPVELGVVFNSAMNQIAEKEQPVRV